MLTRTRGALGACQTARQMGAVSLERTVREQRGRVTVLPKAEQGEIEDRHSPLTCRNTAPQQRGIGACCGLCVDFGGDPVDEEVSETSICEECLGHHPVVAVRMLGRHRALVAEPNSKCFPSPSSGPTDS